MAVLLLLITFISCQPATLGIALSTVVDSPTIQVEDTFVQLSHLEDTFIFESPPVIEQIKLSQNIESQEIVADSPKVVSEGRYLTWDELDASGAAAGWPEGPWLMMRNIVYCETGGRLYTHANNGEDPNGGSYGLAQLNGTQHFTKSGEDFEMRYDPVVNLRVALWLWNARGQIFGGIGGWYHCSQKFGYT